MTRFIQRCRRGRIKYTDEEMKVEDAAQSNVTPVSTVNCCHFATVFNLNFKRLFLLTTGYNLDIKKLSTVLEETDQ